jgi:orotate phosphoribosyltransferase/uridine monophosphate synthetase
MPAEKSIPPDLAGNLWLAETLLELGGVQFGNFTLGRSTVDSPIYLHPRLLISRPNVMKRIAAILEVEIATRMEKARDPIRPFQLVAGVPEGGLHLATAFSLHASIPLVYISLKERPGRKGRIEGKFNLGDTVLIIDDLMTTGGSILETAKALEDEGLVVKDAVVLIDRDQGGRERLKSHGYQATPLLNLRVMLNFYMANGLITEEWFNKSLRYLEDHRVRHG